MKLQAALTLLSLSLSTFSFADETAPVPEPVPAPAPAPSPDPAPMPEPILTPVFGELQYGGTGCPDGTLALGEGQHEIGLSLRFSAFRAEAGEAAFSRKACALAVPVKVPEGYRMSVMAIDTAGHLDLTEGARASLQVENFFAGQGRGVAWKQSFYGPVHEAFTASDNTSEEFLAWSACGADTILRSNVVLLVKANAQRETASASIDTGLVYRVLLEKCEQEEEEDSELGVE